MYVSKCDKSGGRKFRSFLEITAIVVWQLRNCVKKKHLAKNTFFGKIRAILNFNGHVEISSKEEALEESSTIFSGFLQIQNDGGLGTVVDNYVITGNTLE